MCARERRHRPRHEQARATRRPARPVALPVPRIRLMPLLPGAGRPLPARRRQPATAALRLPFPGLSGVISRSASFTLAAAVDAAAQGCSSPSKDASPISTGAASSVTADRTSPATPSSAPSAVTSCSRAMTISISLDLRGRRTRRRARGVGCGASKSGASATSTASSAPSSPSSASGPSPSAVASRSSSPA